MDETAPRSEAAARVGGNIPEYSVGDLSGAIRRILEGAFGRIRVRGEVTEAKFYPSGHCYFSLKDEAGKIRAVIWKSALGRCGLRPENGVEVIATGKISAYGDRSEYQLVVDRLEYAGAGALLARVEALRLRLAAEGLFDQARKQALPVLPGVVGVITSSSGAVLHDIMTTVARRFARPILLWATPVQGEGAAARIAAAIEGMDRLPALGIARPDVLIVARGGGSLEDLMAFNEEVVVRAAAACRIPLISAVGHETDTTLIDFASARRAPTPTAAAELAVPQRSELMAGLAQRSARLIGALTARLQSGGMRLGEARARLPDLPSIVAGARMRVDDRALRLELALPNLVTARHAALVRAERHLPDPHALLAARQGSLEVLRLRLLAGLRHSVQGHRTNAARAMQTLDRDSINAKLRGRQSLLAVLAARLDGSSYARVLARGFALIRRSRGEPVTCAANVRPGDVLEVTFGDGAVSVVVRGKQAMLPL